MFRDCYFDYKFKKDYSYWQCFLPIFLLFVRFRCYCQPIMRITWGHLIADGQKRIRRQDLEHRQRILCNRKKIREKKTNGKALSVTVKKYVLCLIAYHCHFFTITKNAERRGKKIPGTLVECRGFSENIRREIGLFPLDC